jgi:hypothetical protein
MAVWRPGNTTWYIICSSGASQHTRQWGQLGDIPGSMPALFAADERGDVSNIARGFPVRGPGREPKIV